MGKIKKPPIRTCVSCRQPHEKKDLVRVVKNKDGIFLDKTGKKDGRGAYICKNKQCIERAVNKKIFNKVFSCSIDDGVYKNLLEEFFDT